MSLSESHAVARTTARRLMATPGGSDVREAANPTLTGGFDFGRNRDPRECGSSNWRGWRPIREQLTKLVNAHAAAVVPVSVHTVLSQLEREPGEFIVDPWVRQRATLVWRRS